MDFQFSIQRCFFVCLVATTCCGMDNNTRERLALRSRAQAVVDEILAGRQKKQVIRNLTDALNKCYGEHAYPNRMKLIKQAIIEYALHPDEISYWGIGIKFPLEEAVKNSDQESIQFLLKQGADPRRTVIWVDKEAPLIYYAKTESVAQLLLQAGAIPDDSIFDPIITHSYDPRLVSLYGRHGAVADSLIGGHSPLHRLLYSVIRFNESDEAMIQQFMSAGVSLNQPCADTKSPFLGLTCVQLFYAEQRKVSSALYDKKASDVLFACFKKLALQRRMDINSLVDCHMPAVQTALVLEYYERENFNHTAEQIAAYQALVGERNKLRDAKTGGSMNEDAYYSYEFEPATL